MQNLIRAVAFELIRRDFFPPIDHRKLLFRMARNKRKSPKIRSTSRSSNQEEASFNDSDRATLNEINESVKDLKEEIRELKLSLVKAKKEIAEVKAENAASKQAINLNIYNHDDLEQYNRRENIKI